MATDQDLDDWAAEVCVALGLPVELAAHRQLILDVARDAAHNVMRPAAPLTTFLVGYAAGRSASDNESASAVTAAAAIATELALSREAPTPE